MASNSIQLPVESNEFDAKCMKSTSAFMSTDEGSSGDSLPPADSLPCTPPSPLRCPVGPYVFSASMLLAYRASLSTVTTDDSGMRGSICQAKLPPPSYETNGPSKSKIVAPVRHHQTAAPLTPSKGSWVAQQRSSEAEKDDNERVAGAARSILNKITAETFDPLFEQLVCCGIEQPSHIFTLMREVFDSATKQHHFIPMYADVCAKLEQDKRISAVVESAGQQHQFRRLLLNQCQIVFEQLLEPCDAADADLASDEEVGIRRKQEALGNIKLIGHLLTNGMLGSNMLIECAEQLISKRTTCHEALESLAALMMVAAPTFDTTEWPHHEKLVSCFNTIKKLTKDKAIVPRSRFLLRDVLDVRDAGWPKCSKNTAVIKAELKSINVEPIPVEPEVLPQTPATKQDILAMAAEAPAPAQKKVQGVPGSFDLKAFRRTLAAILSDLTSDKNVSKAVQRVRAEQVPVDRQAEQFTDLITRIVEEKRGPPRRCAMAFAAGLAAADKSAFDREQCLTGLTNFFQDVYPDLCDEVPRLPAVVRSELTPTFYSVFPQDEINSRLPPGVRF